MPLIVYFAIALILTFWVRALFARLFRAAVSARWLPWAANLASLATCTVVTGSIRTSNLEAFNPSPAYLYLVAQAVWLTLDLLSARRRPSHG